MHNNLDDDSPGRFSRVFARAKRRAANSVQGQDGSALWLVRACIEWGHEFIKAVNSLMAVRRAQKQFEADTARDEAGDSAPAMQTEQDEARRRRIEVYTRAQTERRGKHSRTVN